MRLDEYTVFPYQAGDVIFAMRNGQPAILIDPTTLPGSGVTDTNFGNDDIVFTNDRWHDLDGYSLELSGASNYKFNTMYSAPLGLPSFEFQAYAATLSDEAFLFKTNIGNAFVINGDKSSEFTGTVTVNVPTGVNTQFKGGGQVVVGDTLGSAYFMEINGTGALKRGLYATSSGLIAIRADETSGTALSGNVDNGIAVFGRTSSTGVGVQGSATVNGGIAGWFIGDTLIESTSTAVLTAGVSFEVRSTTKGSIPAPKMTGAQAEAINSGSPAEGTLIYATNGNGATITSKGWWGFDGTNWVKLN